MALLCQILCYLWLLLQCPIVFGAVHKLFVGNLLAPATIRALEFNDGTHDFKITGTFNADASHAWIALNHDKTALYGASIEQQRVASYEVANNGTSLKLIKNTPAQGHCQGQTSAFVLPSPEPPYRVFTASWPGPNSCGMSFSVDKRGTLHKMTYSWKYVAESGVHGLAFGGNDSELLYSADLKADLVWTHKIDYRTGRVEELGRIKMDREGSHPRHLVAHPDGRYLYVLNEAANTLAAFVLDDETGVASEKVDEHPLIPEGQQDQEYWSAEVMLSRSSRYLWATARAEDQSDNTGFINCFLLSSEGIIIKKMFIVPTTTTGGIANAIAPAPWSDEWAAMTDYPAGYVQMWRMEGQKETENGLVEYETARAVAKVDMGDGGCCANVAWYS